MTEVIHNGYNDDNGDDYGDDGDFLVALGGESGDPDDGYGDEFNFKWLW